MEDHYKKVLAFLGSLPTPDRIRAAHLLKASDWPDWIVGKPEDWDDWDWDEKTLFVSTVRGHVKALVGNKAMERFYWMDRFGFTEQEFEDRWVSFSVENLQKKIDDTYEMLCEHAEEEAKKGTEKRIKKLESMFFLLIGSLIGVGLAKIVSALLLLL